MNLKTNYVLQLKYKELKEGYQEFLKWRNSYTSNDKDKVIKRYFDKKKNINIEYRVIEERRKVIL